MERRTIFGDGSRVKLEERAGKPRIVYGYGAVYYDGTPSTEFKLWEGFVERIMPGAFDRAIQERDDARSLFNHDPNMILGRISAGTLTLETDDQGLLYRAMPGDTQAARDVQELIQRGDVTGSSFSFQVTDQSFETVNGIDIRMIKGVRLFDVGPVTFPAYEGTTTGTSSGLEITEAREALETYRRGRGEAMRALRARTARAREASLRRAELGAMDGR